MNTLIFFMKPFRVPALTVLLFLFALEWMYGQDFEDHIVVDSNGILKWNNTGLDVTGFGVNYTLPFAYGYRLAKKKGADLMGAIEQDVTQFSRLGFDLFRVHVWDTEISDTMGNLLGNEHLELFDYLLYQLKLHHIRAVITPIAYWGNGWPEKDENTPGFSHKFGKDGCLTNPEALAAQRRYLYQFVSHVNHYTGIAYKDEPYIIAFEISNEPHHRGTPEEVTSFIRDLKWAITSTGCRKPVLYNVSHAIQLAPAYYNAGIEGGTFQWYPTGLGFQKEIGGNMLPTVDCYPIPFDDVMTAHHSIRFTYEFDSPDMLSTYMYPAMARSLRGAGIQLATQFAYDPTYSAPYNTEYNTHFMNLIYAPRKALSLMIAGEVFRQIPLYSDYGKYPDNTAFGPFDVSYEKDLAEMVTETKFYYTNNTTTMPPAPDKLVHIAGWGNSPIVEYEGTGAYFLDKLAPGIWKLEVYPDAIQIDNVFGRNSPDKRRVVTNERKWPIKIHLKELNTPIRMLHYDFTNNDQFDKAEFDVAPGAYLLVDVKLFATEDSNSKVFDYFNTQLPPAYYAHPVAPSLDSTYVLPKFSYECTAGKDVEVRATIASPNFPDSVALWIGVGGRFQSINMDRVHGYDYKTVIPAQLLHEGTTAFYITLYNGQNLSTYPSGGSSVPNRPDFDAILSYSFQVVTPAQPLTLFDAPHDAEKLNRPWLPGSNVVLDEKTGLASLVVKTTDLVRTDPENVNGEKHADYSMRHYFGDLVAGRQSELALKKALVFEGYTMDNATCPLQLTLVMKDGSGFGGIIKLNPKNHTYTLPIKKLKKVKVPLLPRPYPTFLPYYSMSGDAEKLDITKVESLIFSVGPGMRPDQIHQPHDFRISRVYLK